ncbi:Lrp/AsnC ligand binding domain-containing protein [Streptomyces sp. Ru72]|uniref:Lrp/AsnC ligand binding domain-containing protein n=1 Tax=Streptomyces sp. Ru72 TaxID=2080747 RepID=UPI000CDE04C2|nr:Lrp/AsnC ligand binding domain-containing protein [Streptomyces sp. Ru72]POX52880.1 hypothetical protein C3488_07515 [Streptomyces sp. Ru72]
MNDAVEFHEPRTVTLGRVSDPDHVSHRARRTTRRATRLLRPNSGASRRGHLSRIPQVRFTAATTGSARLLVAVAAADLNALYRFLSDTVGALEHIITLEVTPILTGVKRTDRPGPPRL